MYRRPIPKIVAITFNNKTIHMFESFPYHDRHRCRTHITMPLETNAQVLATTFDATRRFCNLVMAESKTFDADTVFFLHVKLSFWLTVVNTCAAAYSHQSTKLKYYIHVSFLYTRPACRQTKYIKSFHLFDFWHDALINPNVQITIACRVHACVLSTPSFGSTSSEQRTCFCFCCFIRWPTTCWHSEIDLLRKCGKNNNCAAQTGLCVTTAPTSSGKSMSRGMSHEISLYRTTASSNPQSN